MSTTVYQPGDVVYHSDDQGWFLLYKILKYESGNTCLARCYWPSDDEPTFENWQLFDLRTSCEELEIPAHATILTNESVSHEDEEAIAIFLRIRSGIESRKTAWKQLLSEAETMMRQENYEGVVTCCTECASFVKYEARVFQLRGQALLHLKRYSEAIADLEHALTIQPENAEVLYNCALAYAESGKVPEAILKLNTFQQSVEDSETLQQLKKRLTQ